MAASNPSEGPTPEAATMFGERQFWVGTLSRAYVAFALFVGAIGATVAGFRSMEAAAAALVLWPALFFSTTKKLLVEERHEGLAIWWHDRKLILPWQVICRVVPGEDFLSQGAQARDFVRRIPVDHYYGSATRRVFIIARDGTATVIGTRRPTRLAGLISERARGGGGREEPV